MDDRIFGHAAELGFYFLFAMFPTLFTASSILGLIARSATKIYDRLLHYLALVIPTQAFGIVQHTFNETTAHSSSGKLTFGLIAAIWSASVGVSALQDTLNAVYNIEDSRSYIKARMQAIGLTIVADRDRLLLSGFDVGRGLFRCPCAASDSRGLPANDGASSSARVAGLDGGHGPAGAGIRGDLLLGARPEDSLLALAHAGRRHRHRGLAACVSRVADLSQFLQQLFRSRTDRSAR